MRARAHTHTQLNKVLIVRSCIHIHTTLAIHTLHVVLLSSNMLLDDLCMLTRSDLSFIKFEVKICLYSLPYLSFNLFYTPIPPFQITCIILAIFPFLLSELLKSDVPQFYHSQLLVLSVIFL